VRSSNLQTTAFMINSLFSYVFLHFYRVRYPYFCAYLLGEFVNHLRYGLKYAAKAGIYSAFVSSLTDKLMN
ncbi:hypothetical protein THOM_0503, partial [Trachipleistophora hominis]